MNEPSVFGAPDWTMPEDNIHLGSDDLPKDIHQRYHNVYGMLMVKASKEGIQTANPNKRPFVLTRSNFIGGQRYAATWTGDNASTWKHLQMSIPMVLNMGLSGQPFTGPDIGGFNEDATPELFGQWIALGAFYPFSRGHTRAGSINHEPWAFGKKIENVSRTALQRRYRLLPYFYTLFHESAVNGMPVMRPVFFADYKDRNLRSEDQAFLLGEDLLIIPKWAEFPKLPKGDWRRISIVGEDTQKDKYQPEVKLRPGAILPLSNVIQNTTEYTLETLTLYINLDEKGEAEGKLYNDAGDGFDYKKGQYSLTTFSARTKGNEVIVKVENIDGKQKLNTKKIIVNLYTDTDVLSAIGNLKKPIKIKL
jgi:alpha-glucosidase